MDIPFTSARQLARLIRTRKVSATEVMRAFIAQVERVNPKVNAIVTFLPEQAIKAAKALDRRRGDRPPLAGLPIAYKDLVPTKGIRTTMGSLAFKDNVPKEDALLVERLKAAGAITLGKTNTPEFGAGSNTFNAVFGATRNPYDLTRTAGGSSGGAGAAVACGMLPFADGSDLAIEVVWTSGGVDKLDLYRKLGVREVWFWERGAITPFVLRGDQYAEASASEVLPGIRLGQLAGFLDRPTTSDAMRAYRAALQE